MVSNGHDLLSEPGGVLNARQMALCKKDKKKETGNVSHRLPDSLCQQVRALIDLRLPNCPVINETLCSVPSFLLILTLFIWFWGGHSWVQCERLAVSPEFIFLRMRL